MADNVEVAWLAGLLEGEGTFVGTRRGRYNYYAIQLVMTDQDVVAKAAALLGAHAKEQANVTKGGKKLYRTGVYGPHALGWMLTLYPHMGLRRCAKIDECLTAWREAGAYVSAGKYEKRHGDTPTLRLLRAGKSISGGADNVTANPGSGGATFASDDIGPGVQYPRCKITLGADGVNDGDVSASNPMPVTAAAFPLPAGAATEATLAALDAKVTAVDTGAVTVAGSALPTGASTAANQTTGNASLASIDGKITAVNTGAVVVASSALPTGAATSAKQPALGTAGSASTDVLTVQGIASMTPLLTTGAGNVAHDAADSGNPVKIGARARSSTIAAVASDDRTDLIADLTGKLIVRPHALPEVTLTGNPSVITDTTSTSVIAAQGSGVRIFVTSVVITNADATVGTLVSLKDGSGGTTLFQAYCAAAGGGVAIPFPMPLRLTADTALHAVCGTTSAEVYVSAQGYTGP